MALLTNLVALADSPEALRHLLGPQRAWPGGGGDPRPGFVPTMGALHAGHLALVQQAAARHRQVVVSIFVNPAQFGPGEDYGRYPRTLAADLALLETLGAPLVVYAPPVEALYAEGSDLRLQLPALSARWEGAHRPGHFDGVCLVLAKLFGQVQPAAVYMGHKDFQQTVVVRRLIGELYLPIELVVLPTVREGDGLALSSRNRYLSPEQRAQAPRLYAALQHARQALLAGAPVAPTLAQAQQALEPEFVVDYLALVDGHTLEPLAALPPHDPAGPPPTLIATARLGSTRLLDNLAVA